MGKQAKRCEIAINNSHKIKNKVVPMYRIHKKAEVNMIRSELSVTGMQNYMAGYYRYNLLLQEH